VSYVLVVDKCAQFLVFSHFFECLQAGEVLVRILLADSVELFLLLLMFLLKKIAHFLVEKYLAILRIVFFLLGQVALALCCVKIAEVLVLRKQLVLLQLFHCFFNARLFPCVPWLLVVEELVFAVP
jgi:hypothetical protein